jgi:hypothetical protein
MKFLFVIAMMCHFAHADSLDGIWRSQGYGYAFDIQGSKLKAFEVTTTTCVPGFTADRATIATPGSEATFKTSDGDEFFVRESADPDHKLMHNEGSASDMRIDRVPKMPEVCDKPTANTPTYNFEIFTRTWAEHYISFDLKHTYWEKLVTENRSKVNAKTTPAQLFHVLESMIKEFGDAHTFISAPALKLKFHGLRPGTDRLLKEGFRTKKMPELLHVTEKAFVKGPLRNFCNQQIQYGHLDGAIGYLRILSFSGFSKEGGFKKGLQSLESALDEIFSDAAIKALVIDVRINFGGADPYGLAIASRLATNEYLAYTKEARSDPIELDKWTPGDPSVVRPSSRPGFRGPVIELIGPITISAGETFTQALMGRTPHIARIGENTQGVFSDVLSRRLPNGWIFGLPNEVFRTSAGTTYDGPGIPPDIEIPVFADKDVAAGRDPGMAKAIELLKGK